MINYNNPLGNSINGIVSLPDVQINGDLEVDGTIVAINQNSTISNLISTNITVSNSLLAIGSNHTLGSVTVSGGNVGIGITNPSALVYINTTKGSELIDRTKSLYVKTNQAGIMLDTILGKKYNIWSEKNDSLNNAGGLSIYDETDQAYRMVICSSGNVGIGLANSPALLYLNSNALTTTINRTNSLYIKTGQAGIVLESNTGGQYNIWSENITGTYPRALNFFDQLSSAYRMIIASTGNIAIGDINPTAKLHVSGSFAATSGTVPNMVSTNICTGTLSATTLVTSANIAANLITAGTLRSTNITVGTSLIVSTGNIGIGTNNPLFKLDVNGNVFFSGLTALGSALGNTLGSILTAPITGNVGIGGNPGTKFDFYAGAATDSQFRINSSGSDCTLSLRNTKTGGREYWIGSTGDGAGASAGTLYFYDNSGGGFRMVISSTGNLGIGTAHPLGKIDVVGSTSLFSVFRGSASDADSKTTLNAVNTDAMLMSTMSGSTMFFYGRNGGTNYRNTWAASTYFTGQHGNKPIAGEEYLKSNLTDYVGLIVSSADNGYYSVNPVTKTEITGKDAIQISEALPKIKLTTVDQDKSVWGVVTNVKNDNYNTNGIIEKDDETEWSDRLENCVRVNGLGEGAIWVSNINGNIENGDYICSSLIPGYGKRQNSEFLVNYTVAKATCSVNFTENLETKFNLRYLNPNGTLITKAEYLTKLANNENVYIAAFIGCSYHCS